MRLLAALSVAAWLAATPRASAAPGDATDAAGPGDDRILDYLWQRAKKELERASEELEPPLNPPKRVKVRWRARRVWSGRLGAPLLDVTAVDVDGDKRAELVALTTAELVVLRIEKRKAKVIARIKLPGSAASMRPRMALGAVSHRTGSEGVELVARASGKAKAATFVMKDGKLVDKGASEGFPLCDGITAVLEPGRNYFSGKSLTVAKDSDALLASSSVPEQFFSARCRRGMVDAKGRSLRVASVVDTSGKLTVITRLTCRSTDAECRAKPQSTRTVRGVGTSFLVADIDNDGTPEIITAAHRAPGARDRVQIRGGAGAKRIIFRRNFIGGVVGLAAGDLDGDGDQDVVAAIRFFGQERIGLWALN